MDRAGDFKSAIFQEHVAVAHQSREDRRVLHESALVRVESRSAANHQDAVEDAASATQLVMPYLGVFEWRSDNRSYLLDTNAFLLAKAGRLPPQRRSAAGLGYAYVMVTPSARLLEALKPAWAVAGSDSGDGAPNEFCPGLRVKLHEWIALLRRPHRDPAALDDLALKTLEIAASHKPRPRPEPSALMRKAKALLHNRVRERLSLPEVAEALNVSPVYLTQTFTRHEGAPLYRYVLGLRLARAMLRLPECDDITTLAMDLGFSSHSHFSTVFKSFCGLTPSAFRAKVGVAEAAPAQVA